MISEKIMKKLLVEECQKISVKSLKLNKSMPLSLSIDSQNIELTVTNCNYGGIRVWFLCPLCNKRVGTLYRKPLSNSFTCRYCSKLTYQLQRYHRSSNEQLLRSIQNIKIQRGGVIE